MEEQFVAANDFCTYHQIEYTFINSLEDAGLIELTVINEQKFIPHEKLPQVEKMARLHHDLDINIAGIEAITSVLEQVEQLQYELNQLRNRLRIYE
jgi:chaperone modulatory protein CbpM